MDLKRKQFALRLKQALKYRGHDRKTLSELKVLFDNSFSRALISTFKNAKELPSLFSGEILSKKLKVPYAWILIGEGKITDDEYKQLNSPDEVALIERYRTLTSNGRRKLMAYAFTKCSDNELNPVSDEIRTVLKQVSLKLIPKQ